MAKASLHQLDTFAQMVASGDIALCARTLGVSTEDVERDIASLEMRLGYRLFDDLTGMRRLTPAGRKTAQAMTMLSKDEPETWGVDEAEAITINESGSSPMPVRQTIILAAPAPVFGHLQEALAAFEAANEDIAITLDLTVQTAADAARAIQDGTADIAYFYALGEPTDFPSRYGWSEQISLYAGVDHPLARRDFVSVEDLAITPRLAMESSNSVRQLIEQASRQAGIHLGAPVLETDNLFNIVATLRAGGGYFAAFGPLARDLGRMAGIKRVALEISLPSIQVRQTTGHQIQANSAVGALADYLFL